MSIRISTGDPQTRFLHGFANHIHAKDRSWKKHSIVRDFFEFFQSDAFSTENTIHVRNQNIECLHIRMMLQKRIDFFIQGSRHEPLFRLIEIRGLFRSHVG